MKCGGNIDYYVKRLMTRIFKQITIFGGILFLEKGIVEGFVKKFTEFLILRFSKLVGVKNKNYGVLLALTLVLVFAVFALFIFI